MTLNYPQNSVIFSSRFFSAFFCAVTILLIGAIYIFDLVNVTVEMLAHRRVEDDLPRLMGNVIGLLICAVLVLHCGVAFSRFFLRAIPPQLSGRIHLGAILLSLLPAFVSVFVSVSFLFYLSTSDDLLQRNTITIILFNLLGLIWCGAFVLPVLKRHLKPLDFLDRPFVLFLRRFSKFSDRAVINLILRQTPLNKPIVLPMPLHSQAGDWNPLLIGFAGINLNPFFNIPVFVKLQDNEWKQVIELLINRAQIIVFDISEKSDAIEAEFEMIEQAECWQKTLFLQNNYENTNYELEQNIKIRSARIINYRKSWIRGIPRMISGFVILLVLFVLLDKALGQLHPVFRILCRLSEFLLFAWLYFQFFIYPSVDRAAKISLKKILGTHTKSNLARQI